MVDAVGTGALLAADSGPELPTVNDFLPPEILFQGTPFAINRIILIRIVATVVLLVALAIGMSEQVFSNKMNGLRSFSAKDYKALADFFNTSVDYLMGRTLDPWPADNPQPEEAAK